MINEYYFKIIDEGGTPAPTSNNDGVISISAFEFNIKEVIANG